MAVYKVPQDVEADDKLIGPFSFRQFIYLIIVAIAIALGWGLAQLFIPLAIIPLPIILFFGALALPLRKDQPMEIYLAAIVSFYLKPRKRLWQADGIQSLVEITAPKTVEVQRTKDLSQSEAQKRLSYLADIVDTGGWAIRGVTMPDAPSPMKTDVYFEAQQTEDILDTDGGVSRSFNTMISQSDTKRRNDLIARMHEPPAPVATLLPTIPQVADPYATLAPQPQPDDLTDVAQVSFNPYPNAMHQSVITPLSQRPPVAPQPQPPITQPTPQQATATPTVSPTPVQQQSPQPISTVNTGQVTPAQPPQPPQEPQAPTPVPAITTSEKVASPDIINLANNPDLSIETIAREADRIHRREEAQQDEVIISLR